MATCECCEIQVADASLLQEQQFKIHQHHKTLKTGAVCPMCVSELSGKPLEMDSVPLLALAFYSVRKVSGKKLETALLPNRKTNAYRRNLHGKH